MSNKQKHEKMETTIKKLQEFFKNNPSVERDFLNMTKDEQKTFVQVFKAVNK